MDLDGFNANDTPPADNFEPLPPGWYTAHITDSEEKETKAGTGSYLQLVIEILEGPFKGRLLWDRLNLNNPNGTAVEIAKRTLSAICLAVNVAAPRDSSELHYKPLAVRVKQKQFNGELSNEVKGYRSIAANDSAPPSSGTSPTPTKPAAAPAAAKKPPPWKKAG
jgi:hypothetical protein